MAQRKAENHISDTGEVFGPALWKAADHSGRVRDLAAVEFKKAVVLLPTTVDHQNTGGITVFQNLRGVGENAIRRLVRSQLDSGVILRALEKPLAGEPPFEGKVLFHGVLIGVSQGPMALLQGEALLHGCFDKALPHLNGKRPVSPEVPTLGREKKWRKLI